MTDLDNLLTNNIELRNTLKYIFLQAISDYRRSTSKENGLRNTRERRRGEWVTCIRRNLSESPLLFYQKQVYKNRFGNRWESRSVQATDYSLLINALKDTSFWFDAGKIAGNRLGNSYSYILETIMNKALDEADSDDQQVERSLTDLQSILLAMAVCVEEIQTVRTKLDKETQDTVCSLRKL